jgi:tetratricopeptide (TPR) repeat protein
MCPGACALAAAPQDPLPRGQIIEQVRCLDDPGQSYTLYLPSAYSPDKPLPILFCFDPAARGRVPVELFREAAERLNYIVAGSNNSRNGPWAPNLTAIKALLRDTQARLSIRRTRFYTAGMSGGGGPAWQLALSGAAGAIICASAINVPAAELKPVSFALFGVAGIADFNFEYVFGQVATFRSVGKNARFETFEGGHSWPPREVAARALDWLEIQAIRSGLGDNRDDYVETQFRESIARAEQLESGGKLQQAHKAYADLASDFDGLRDVKALRARAEQLGALKQVVLARKQELEIARAQQAELKSLFEAKSIFESPPAPAPGQTTDVLQAVTDAQNGIMHTISMLQQRAKKPLPDSQRIVAQRVLEEFFIQMTTRSSELMRARQYDLAITNYRLCREIRPDSAGILFELARAYAGRRDIRKALESLSKAVDAGYRNGAAIRNAPEMQNLKGERRFSEILSMLEAPR